MWQLEDPTESLTRKQRLAVVDQLQGFGESVHVEVTGGEPFKKFDELLEMASLLKTQGNTMGVVTSGYLITPAIVKSLEGNGVTHVAFSIDFPTAAQHDAQRGRRNTFDKALEAISMLVEMKREGRDVPTVGIDSIIMEQNINYLEDIALLAAELKVNDVLFQPIQPDFGLNDKISFAKFRNWLPSNPSQVSKVLDRIEKLRDQVPLGQTREELELIRQYFYDPIDLQPGICKGPQSNLVVDVTGQVLHCFGQGRTGLRPLGKVPDDNIVDLWRSEVALQNRKILANCSLGCSVLLCHSRNSRREINQTNKD
jgi:MoaA/NifB/PqqE/SkfB family radical SAM enzyme